MIFATQHLNLSGTATRELIITPQTKTFYDQRKRRSNAKYDADDETLLNKQLGHLFSSDNNNIKENPKPLSRRLDAVVVLSLLHNSLIYTKNFEGCDKNFLTTKRKFYFLLMNIAIQDHLQDQSLKWKMERALK